MLELLQQHGIGVLARGSLAQGLLAGKAPKSYLNHTSEEVQRAADVVRQVAGAERSASETAVRFALHHPAVTAAVLGIRTENQLADAVQIANAKPLTAHEMSTLQNALPANKYEQHR